MADDLTAENFIQAIKSMSPRDRHKIRAEKLIELILTLRDDVETDGITSLEKRIYELEAKYDFVKTETISNSVNLENLRLKMDSEPQRTNDDVHSTAIKVLENQLAEVQIHLNAIEQYLRVNNVEIVGLPEPSDDETNEDVILSALNSLPELTFQLTSEHIDISHPIPSKSRDHKRVSICKFISRKAKIDVLEAFSLTLRCNSSSFVLDIYVV